MPWIYGLVGLLVGAIIGIIIARIKTPQYKKHKQMQKALDSAKFELEQQRQELADHFAQTAELLDVLGKDYTKLYQHMANTSQELLPAQPDQDNPFAKLTSGDEQPAEPVSRNLDVEPKDYVKGSTGLLKAEEKEIIEAPEAVKA
jgi:uncharacterized membrane-anchored protein YhcB (DUF1043 family)